MNHARITHRFSFLLGACIVCVIRLWNECGLSVIVSGCASKAVWAWFWVLNGSKFSVCVIHESAFIVYASSMCDYACLRGTRVGRQCWCVGTGLKPRTSTSIHWRPTFISRMNRTSIMFIPLTSTDNHLQNVERLRSVRVWTCYVSDSCVGRALDVRGILHRICSYASTCAICQWYVSDCKWYVRDSCVIRQWFLPLTPRKISQRTSTHKPNLCVICEWFMRDRLCDWPLRMCR
jgi:hypothetical protein